MKRILAIDPGLSGGLAHYGPSGVTLDAMPTTDADVRDLVLDRLGVSDVVFIEKVGGYVGGKGAPGSAMFNFGRNVGFLHGLISSRKIRTIEVPPQTWQKTIQAGTKVGAELLGWNDVGVLEKGKTADMVVFKDNPLDTFENAFLPLMVFQGGELISFRS